MVMPVDISHLAETEASMWSVFWWASLDNLNWGNRNVTVLSIVSSVVHAYMCVCVRVWPSADENASCFSEMPDWSVIQFCFQIFLFTENSQHTLGAVLCRCSDEKTIIITVTTILRWPLFCRRLISIKTLFVFNICRESKLQQLDRFCCQTM